MQRPVPGDLFRRRLPIEAPGLLDPASAWTGHVPFAFWLVDALRPRAIVELGVHAGTSYLAFCEEVARAGTGAACFGIDTWEGDDHAGRYGDEVLRTLRARHDPRYGAFSRLIRARFDDARAEFADGSIDLLHIDGFHSYEAVRHDFETWLPKLSDRAVVLLHDTNERRDGFGVWRFWDEIRAGRPHFHFPHTHGLGVLATGRDVPEALRVFFEADAADAAALRDTFACLGWRLEELALLRAAAGLPAASPGPMDQRAEVTLRRMAAFRTSRLGRTLRTLHGAALRARRLARAPWRPSHAEAPVDPAPRTA